MDLVGRSGQVLHASRKDRLRKQPQFVATAVAEKLAAINTAGFFLERRERADFAAFRGEGWQDHLAARIFECGRRCAVSVDMNCSLQTLRFQGSTGHLFSPVAFDDLSFDHCDWERQGFPTSRDQDLQPLRATFLLLYVFVVMSTAAGA